MVIYGGATAESVATKAQGETAANDAIAAANNLGVPAGVCLFNDVEPGWQVTSEYIDGYWTTIHNSQKYVPGFSADTRTDTATQKYYFNTAYCTVRSQKSGQDCHVWSQWPKVSCGTAAERPTWDPDYPAGLTQDQIGLWQYTATCYACDDSTPWAVDLDELRDTILLDILSQVPQVRKREFDELIGVVSRMAPTPILDQSAYRALQEGGADRVARQSIDTT